MSTVTAVKIADSEQESLTLGELRAWRGLLRAHACLAVRLLELRVQALGQARVRTRQTAPRA